MTASPLPGHFRLSAHLSYLFTELPFAARFAAAGKAGFRAIEAPDPYSLSAPEFRSLCKENDLEVAQIALPNAASGAASTKGIAALPGLEAEFRQALERSIVFATAADCRLIHPMAGMSSRSSPEPQWEVYCSNLAEACRAAGEAGLCVIIEAISERAAPGYFINSLEMARAAIDEVGSSNLLLSIDTYHCAAMDVPLPSFIAANRELIGHVQLADWPRRDEPGSGSVDFDAIFSALRAVSYKGYVGIEYRPSRSGAGQFDWIYMFDEHLEPLRSAAVRPGQQREDK